MAEIASHQPDRAGKLPSFADLPSHRLFAEAIPDILYHYTSLEGAFGILTSRQIWLTKIQHLNDAAELRYAVELFRRRAGSHPAGTTRGMRQLLIEAAEQLGSYLNVNICLASFCIDGDLLSQWRAYAAAANGVAFGFSRGFLAYLSNRQEFQIWKCLYSPEQHGRIIDELIELLLRLRDSSAWDGHANSGNGNGVLWRCFTTIFLQVAPVLKHPSFHEEREWRLISAPVPMQHPDYGVVLAGSRLRPTFRVPFPRDEDGGCRVLVETSIGPSADAALVLDSLATLATTQGHRDLQLNISRIPYRAI